MTRPALALAFLAVTAACAQRADQIAPVYQSSSQYAGVDCAALGGQIQTAERQLATLSAAQNQRANMDAAMVTVGVLVFWPALAATSGTLGPDDQAAAIADLKGRLASAEAEYAARCAS